MDNYDTGLRGDCPGLDRVQVSAEHEKRFKHDYEQGDQGKNASSMIRGAQNARNNAKGKGKQL